MSINITGKNVDAIVKKLNKLMANPSPVLLAGGSGIADEIRLGFRGSRDPWGKAWKPLKIRKGKPLIDTGQMRASIAARVSSSNTAQVFSGDNASKVLLHQFGGPTTINGRRVLVPARPFFPIRNNKVDLPAAWQAGFVADMTAAIRAALR